MWSLFMCLAFSGFTAQAHVGMVLTLEGQVNVISGKQECGLRYGLDIDEGDTVRTGDKAWAVLQLMDGARITLRPATELRIDHYRFVDSSEAKRNYARLTLLRGSLRVVTGAIVRGRNLGYQVRAADATVEMRGADHDVTHIAPASVQVGEGVHGAYGKSYAGEAAMSTANGSVTLRDGQTAFVATGARTPPRLLTHDPWFFVTYGSIDQRASAVAGALSGPNIP